MVKNILLAALFAFIAAFGFVPLAFAQQPNVRVVTACGALSPYGTVGAGTPYSMTMDPNGNLCTAASVSASISGFTATSTGTPIAVTNVSTTGTLPAGSVVVATNVGSTNGAYCALGPTATTANQYLSPGGGWFAFTVGSSTQLSCITSTSTTTVNMTGGSGLPTGTGGGGGGSSGGNVNITQWATTNLGAPTAVGTQGTGNAPNVNATIVGGTVSATFSPFAPNGSYATPLAVGAASSNVALPTGTAAGVYNTGTSPAFVNLGVGSGTTATASDILVAPGGFQCLAVGSNTFLAAIETAGATTLNIAGGSGGCAGSGGAGGGPVTAAGTSATSAAAVQGVTGGVPMPVSIGQSSGATIPINISTATTTQLVALSAGKSIYVTSWDVIAGGTGNITLEYGTGSNCGTGTTVLTGAYPLTAQTGIAKGDGLGTILLVPSGNALCALTSAAVQMSGSMSYTQQ